jgi:NTE family protein
MLLSKAFWRRSPLLTVGLFFLFFTVTAQAPRTGRPKIGVTLSGGGAKGLAHIGILKAIDSAGLNVDYITGTSMGGIIGSLYAVGYSADSIEKLAAAIDWDLLLSNQSSLRSIFMEEKDEYAKYVIELPWVSHRFRLPSGVLQGQELWLKFSELFFPVYNQKDFSRFSIPFRCIGTDVGSGEAVVMKEGEIIGAVRSSMAIPSVFTAVDFNGKKLIDGGVVRNFPVRDVKEMGADFVIGSNVATGLIPADKVRNAIQVLLQVAFFREAEDNRQEVPQCNIYVPFNMEKYSMGSFSDAKEILDLGLEEGRKLYPRFKQLADSLDAIYGPQVPKKNRLPKVDDVTISAYEVHGVEKTSAEFFVHTMNFEQNKAYTAKELANMVRQAYGTRYYSRVTYSLLPQPDGTAKIVFEVAEYPFTFAKLGMHYNRFTGVGLIANITARNFFTTNSRSLVTMNVGETFRIRGEHLQYFGRLKNVALILETQYDNFDIGTYTEAKQDGLYDLNFFKFASKLQFSAKRQFTVGLGGRLEWVKYNPKISTELEFIGSKKFFTPFAYLMHNSLDKAVYPNRGFKLDAELGWVAPQNSRIRFFENGVQVPPNLITISDASFYRARMDVETYTPLSKRTNLLFNVQAGANFDYLDNALNEFIIGGLTKTFRNQVTFAGLPEGSVFATSVAAIQGGLRMQIFNNTFLTGRANVMFNNFVDDSGFFLTKDFFSGYALTFSYNFALGPLEISAMYCDQTRKIQSYVNIGIPF